MQIRPIRHRRARRVDFEAICAIVAACGLPVPPPARAGLRHFRRVVADLGVDLYVADVDARVLGIVHVSYTRSLTSPPRARLELVAVAPEVRRQGIGRGLVAFAAARARRRGCDALRAAVPGDGVQSFFLHTGWRGRGETFEFDLAVPAQ